MMPVSVATQDIHIHPKDFQCTSGVFTKKHCCDFVCFECCFFSLAWQTNHSDCHTEMPPVRLAMQPPIDSAFSRSFFPL